MLPLRRLAMMAMSSRLQPFMGVLEDGELIALHPVDAVHGAELDGHLHRLLVVAPLSHASRAPGVEVLDHLERVWGVKDAGFASYARGLVHEDGARASSRGPAHSETGRPSNCEPPTKALRASSTVF